MNHTSAGEESHGDAGEIANSGSGCNVLGNFSVGQCQQLIAVLSAQLQQNTQGNEPQMPLVSNFSGIHTVSRISSFHNNSDTWILDSGTTHHVCCTLSSFYSVTDSHIPYVSLPNGLTASIHKVGNVRLSSLITLKDVLYVPSFKYNLISISALTQQTSSVLIFSNETCVIQDVNKRNQIGMGRRFGNLYSFNKSDFSSTLRNIVSFPISNNTLCHYRLGHPSRIKSHALNKELTFNSSNDTDFICHDCHLSKQKRLPFISHNNLSGSVFDLIHYHIWGPFHIISVEGYKYFLTIVDDHSRYTWIYPLHAKSDAQKVIPSFFTLVQTQFNKKIKASRSDNAKELLFSDFCNFLGVIHYKSCVQRPQ